MAAPVTRTQIRARVRSAAQQANVQGFVLQDALDDLIREGADELYNLLLEARGADFYSKRYDFNLVLGQEVYDLPTNFLRLKSALIGNRPFVGGRFGPVNAGSEVVSPDVWRELPRLPMRELDVALNRRGDHAGAFRYYLGGEQAESSVPTPVDQLLVAPVPRQVFGVRLTYLPTCSHYETGGEVTYNGISGYEAYVVAHCLADIVAQQDQSPEYWLGKKRVVAKQVEALAVDRDEAQPKRIASRWSASDDHLGLSAEEMEDLLWR